MILCVRVRGVRLELNFTKIGGYGDTEIRKRPCGEGGKREGRGRAKMVDTEIRVQDRYHRDARGTAHDEPMWLISRYQPRHAARGAGIQEKEAWLISIIIRIIITIISKRDSLIRSDLWQPHGFQECWSSLQSSLSGTV